MRENKRNKLSEFTDESFKILLQNNSHHGSVDMRIEKSRYESLPSKRAGHKLTLWHDIPMLTGGEIYAAQRELNTSECYLKDNQQKIITKGSEATDEQISVWQLLPDMNEGPRKYHSMVVFRNSPFSGTAWVCGGELWKRAKASGKLMLEVVSSCECFNRYYMKWMPCPTMNYARKYATSASSYFGIYQLGGEDKQGRILNSVEYVEPLGGGKWTRKTSLPIRVKSAAAVCIHDELFLFGGFDGEKSIANVFYLNRTNWVDFGNLLSTRSGHTVTAMQSTVLIYGGEDDGQRVSAEVLNMVLKTSGKGKICNLKMAKFN